MKVEEILALVKTLVERVDTLESRVKELSAPRDRGPKSEREMSELDAFRVKFGDLKDIKPKQAAEALGLSYGQVYSCRGGYTFKHVRADWKKPEQKQEPAEQEPAEKQESAETQQ